MSKLTFRVIIEETTIEMIAEDFFNLISGVVIGLFEILEFGYLAVIREEYSPENILVGDQIGSSLRLLGNVEPLSKYSPLVENLTEYKWNVQNYLVCLAKISEYLKNYQPQYREKDEEEKLRLSDDLSRVMEINLYYSRKIIEYININRDKNGKKEIIEREEKFLIEYETRKKIFSFGIRLVAVEEYLKSSNVPQNEVDKYLIQFQERGDNQTKIREEFFEVLEKNWHGDLDDLNEINLLLRTAKNIDVKYWNYIIQIKLGIKYRNIEDYSKAIEHFTYAGEIWYQTPIMLFHRGESFYSLGNFEKAKGDFVNACNISINMGGLVNPERQKIYEYLKMI